MKNFINKIVSNSLDNENTIDLKSFIKNCNGCFIVDCIDSLKSIKNLKKETIIKSVSENNKSDFSKYYKYINYKPVPHMVDADWRFTIETQQNLVNKINKYVDKNKNNCLFVGTPSILHNKEVLNLKNLKISLVEKNETNINFENKIVCDILDFNPDEKFNVILCDPPWYKLAYKNFLYKFSQVMEEYGYLFLIFPPNGVRQSITNEKKEILTFAQTLGFRLYEEDVETINYYSSPFEVNSIIDNKIYNFPIDWRFGNLFIFQFKRQDNIKFEYYPSLNNNEWEEFVIKNIRIKIKNSIESKNKPVLEKIYLSDVLPTVSNRNEKLKEVNFWTSGNRVYKCNNVGVIKEILRFRSIKSFEKCLLKFSKYKNLVNLIENIINKEYEEYGQYWE